MTVLTPREWIEVALERYNEKLSGPLEPRERGRLVLTSLLEVLEEDEEKAIADKTDKEVVDDWDKFLAGEDGG